MHSVHIVCGGCADKIRSRRQCAAGQSGQSGAERGTAGQSGAERGGRSHSTKRAGHKEAC